MIKIDDIRSLHIEISNLCNAQISVKVESSWTEDRYEEGRLMQCDVSCGRKNNSYHQKLP